MTETTTAGARMSLGRYGEDVAERHLREQGMAVLDRNWRCSEGELDLVLRDGDVLVACEVKTRTSLIAGTPHEAITDEKLARLKRLAEAWCHAHALHPPDTRIDLVAVLRPRRGPAIVDHVRGLA